MDAEYVYHNHFYKLCHLVFYQIPIIFQHLLIMTRQSNNPGSLVLSTLAGAANELTDAILVNPYDVDGVADGVHQAINMPAGERRERYQGMIEVLKRNDITAWRVRFVDALLKANERIQLPS